MKGLNSVISIEILPRGLAGVAAAAADECFCCGRRGNEAARRSMGIRSHCCLTAATFRL